MFSLSKLVVLLTALCTLCATASASASQFTASATGTLSGKATTTHSFSFAGEVVQCNTAETTGTILYTAWTEQHVTVNYKNCTMSGIPVHVSAATYRYIAEFIYGSVSVQNSITFTVTVPLFPDCHLTIGPQNMENVSYSSFEGKLNVNNSISGIAYTSSGGFCGSSEYQGSYTGSSRYERVGGGSLAYDS